MQNSLLLCYVDSQQTISITLCCLKVINHLSHISVAFRRQFTPSFCINFLIFQLLVMHLSGTNRDLLEYEFVI